MHARLPVRSNEVVDELITGLHTAIIHDANLIIIATDPNGIVQLFNPAAERMLGYRADEVIGRASPLLFHVQHELAAAGLDIEALSRGVRVYDPNSLVAQIQAGPGAAKEWTYVRKDGATFPVLLSVSALRDPAGNLLGHVGLAADISPLKQADRQLRYYASLQEAVHDAVIATDLEYRIQSWNQAAERLYGWRAEEVIGQVVTDLLQTDYVSALTREDVRQQFQREGYWTGEVTQQCKDGSRLHMLASVALVRDAAGVPMAVVAINHDITHLKRAEQALRESQERLQILFDNSPDALVLCSLDGVVTDINVACEALAGWPRADVRGVHFADLRLMDETAVLQAVALMQQYRQGESNPAFDFTLYRRDRTTVEVEARVYPVTLLGQSHFLTAIRDITLRKRGEEELRAALQQQAELNTLKSRFISMVSHEFRTPLSTILATVESLSAYRQHMDAAQVERRLGKVREQVGYMQDMLNDVLMVAAMQAEKISVNPVALNIDAFCRDILDEMKPADAARIDYECAPLPLVIQTDKKLMRQIVGNLLSNALKYSPEERPIHFAVNGHDQHVTVMVRDEGIGILEADQKHLFEPFHRGTNVGAISGSGLGMSIIRQSVEALRGAIDVRSQAGQGTTVTVTLPRQLDPGAPVDDITRV